MKIRGPGSSSLIRQRASPPYRRGKNDRTNAPIFGRFGVAFISLIYFGLSAVSFATSAWDDSFRVQLTREGTVHTVVVQADDRILIQGNFQWVGPTPRNGIARLNANGSLDESFDPGSQIVGTPLTLALLADGKILVGARVQWNRVQVYRYHADGALDETFDNGIGFERLGFVGDDSGMELLPLPEGKLLVGGFFHRFGTTNRASIARLLSNGDLDPTFDPGTALDNFTAVKGLAIDGESGYLVRTQPDGSPAGFLRLLTNGTAGSNVPLSEEEKQRVQLPILTDGRRVLVEGDTVTVFSTTGDVETIWTNIPAVWPGNNRHYSAIQADGKLLVPGIGHDLSAGKANFGLVRLLTNGAVDPGFTMPGGVSVPNLGIHQVSSQTNGSLLVRGDFRLVNGVRRANMARLNPDGTLDASFKLGDVVFPGSRFALTSTGQILTSGTVCPEGGSCNHGLWRLDADGARDVTFFATPLYCEGIFDVVFHPRAGVLLSTRTGVSCWSHGFQQPLLRRANASDGTMDDGLVVTSDAGWGSHPGQVRYILPHPLDSTTYVVGDFTHLGGTPSAGVARVLTNGTVDPAFQFVHPELLGWGALGAHVHEDGRLTLLTTEIDHGHLLTIESDGSVAADVLVSASLPQIALGTLRFEDGSWVVMSKTSASPEVTLVRIGPTGRLLARRTVLVELDARRPGSFTTALDADQRLMIGAPQLLTSSGPWSGLLRLKQAALDPVTLRFTVPPATARLAVHGPVGQRARIETSTNLTAWNEWMELTFDTAETSLDVSTATSPDQLFYRAMLLAE